MASSSNTSGGQQDIMVTRMDQEVLSRLILVDFAMLDIQNATIAANEMKDFIATLTKLPPSQVKNLIVRTDRYLTRVRDSGIEKSGLRVLGVIKTESQ
jgi:hypothetical protein